MRILANIIDQMIVMIPPREKELIERLKDTKQSSLYAAPELESFWWKVCAKRLTEGAGEPTGGWRKQVALIFSGEEK